jgi:hypothetical protein
MKARRQAKSEMNKRQDRMFGKKLSALIEITPRSSYPRKAGLIVETEELLSKELIKALFADIPS